MLPIKGKMKCCFTHRVQNARGALPSSAEGKPEAAWNTTSSVSLPGGATSPAPGCDLNVLRSSLSSGCCVAWMKITRQRSSFKSLFQNSLVMVGPHKIPKILDQFQKELLIKSHEGSWLSWGFFHLSKHVSRYISCFKATSPNRNLTRIRILKCRLYTKYWDVIFKSYMFSDIYPFYGCRTADEYVCNKMHFNPKSLLTNLWLLIKVYLLRRSTGYTGRVLMSEASGGLQVPGRWRTAPRLRGRHLPGGDLKLTVLACRGVPAKSFGNLGTDGQSSSVVSSTCEIDSRFWLLISNK